MDIKYSFADNEESRRLIEYERYFQLLKKLSLLEVVPDEVKIFREKSREINVREIYAFLKLYSEKYDLEFNLDKRFNDINKLIEKHEFDINGNKINLSATIGYSFTKDTG